MTLSFIKKLQWLSFALPLSSALYAMEQGLSQDINKLKLSSQETATLDVKDIKPFASQPFDHIPQYVYENCNQGTKHIWSPEHFEKLKKAVQKLTKEMVRKKYTNEQEYTKAAEDYDWVHGLNDIEENYLKKPLKLSITDIQRINGCLSRLIGGNSNMFRQKSVNWSKVHITDTEHFFYSYLETHNNSIDEGADPYLRYMLDENGKPGSKIAIKNILELVVDYKLHPEALNSTYKFELNPMEVFEWEKETAESPNHQPGTMDLVPWLVKRYHLFPDYRTIESELTDSLRRIEHIKNPIEAAAQLWYEIVRIHPWHEANKRTGKALASLILLKHGYLPPLITGEDGKEYVQAFLQGFGKEDGCVKFVQFIARLIDKTQNQFKGTTL